MDVFTVQKDLPQVPTNCAHIETSSLTPKQNQRPKMEDQQKVQVVRLSSKSAQPENIF